MCSSWLLGCAMNGVVCLRSMPVPMCFVHTQLERAQLECRPLPGSPKGVDYDSGSRYACRCEPPFTRARVYPWTWHDHRDV